MFVIHVAAPELTELTALSIDSTTATSITVRWSVSSDSLVYRQICCDMGKV